MPSAGQLRERFTFEARAKDDNGDRTGDWGADAVTIAAGLQSLRGGEAVQLQRLQGQRSVILTVRRCAATLLIDTTFRAVDERLGLKYAVKGVDPNKDDPRAFLDILAVSGGASG